MSTANGGNWGPSPRVRGSRVGHLAGHLRLGSIPACAGKPRGRTIRPRARRVHPRVCGEAGTGGDPEWLFPVHPRVCGKPSTLPDLRGRLRVHPRVCGEACLAGSGTTSLVGPSPRVRGSPRMPAGSPSATGSIPACAGKPREAHGDGDDSRVHPRVCGEAIEGGYGGVSASGPSPRVREAR